MFVPRTRTLLVALAASVCGCSLLVETSGLGGPDVAQPADGGTAPVEGGTSTSPEGSSDAGSFSCDPTALFCTRFDEGLSAFSATNADPGTTATIDTVETTSPPSSFHVTLPRSNTTLAAGGRRNLPQIYQDLRFRFAMRVDQPVLQAGDRGTHVFELLVDLEGQPAYTLSMEVFADRTVSVYVSKASSDPYRALARPITYGAWHTFDLEVRVGAGTVRIALDGLPAFERSDIGIPSRATPRQVFFDVGAVSYNTPNPGASVRFDDLRVDGL